MRLAELRVLLDDLELLVGERAGLAEDLGGNADLADVVEQRTELDALQRVAIELQLATDEDRDVADPAGVRRGVFVVRLERVRERSDRLDEGSLELVVVLRALDRELRLVRETRDELQLPALRRAVADGRGERSDTRALETERRDDDARRLDVPRAFDPGEILGLEHERVGALEPGVGDRCREAARAGRVGLEWIAV